ncbi:putative redox protein fmp46 [Elsinoe fawcettii]|nr:putative redox protein fmp46 [Elsinoe fawcettii]
MSMFKKLFGEAGVRDVITLFHAPKNPSSIRVYTLLKQTAGTSQSTATEDQASSHDQQSKISRTEFDLQVEENAPTNDQLQSILEYAGEGKAGSVVEGATSVADALKKVRQGSQISRPLLVDWNKGQVVAGDNESEILKLVKALPHKTT